MRFENITIDEIDELALKLDKKYPEILDVYSLSFDKLIKMIFDLDFFKDSLENCSQKKLEAILLAWDEIKRGQ